MAVLAQSWSEVVEANACLASAQSIDGALAPLRATDSTGRSLVGVVANITNAMLNTWGNMLVAAANVFEALELETLPA